MRKKIAVIGLALCVVALIPFATFAHEAYVLPREAFWQGMRTPFDWDAFAAWQNPHNVRLTVEVVAGTLVALALNFLFRRTRFGQSVNAGFERLAFLGPMFVRATVVIALALGATSGKFLGPELDLLAMPFGSAIRWIVLIASGLLAIGFLTELAAAALLVVFFIGLVAFGPYVVTYLNYFGELLVLSLFGMRAWSVDGLLFGKRTLLRQWEKYGATIVRVCYGISLIYAGITVKLLHPDLTARVVTDWNLTQFHWLFPSDPLLVVLGAGLVESVIGLFILVGFEMRLTVLVSLFYITLSLLYFQELVWPHLLLYGISLNLLVQPEIFTLDHLFFGSPKRKNAAL